MVEAVKQKIKIEREARDEDKNEVYRLENRRKLDSRQNVLRSALDVFCCHQTSFYCDADGSVS